MTERKVARVSNGFRPRHLFHLFCDLQKPAILLHRMRPGAGHSLTQAGVRMR
jgi:hypothetical protein